MNSIVRVGRASKQSFRCNQYLQLQRVTFSSSAKEAEQPKIPRNTLKNLFSANEQQDNGKIYDKKPFKMRLEAGKHYHWCLCGKSKSQPLCDGTHRDVFVKVKQRPIRFMVDETKEYWLCNCKQTSNRPFCDGSHKRQEIQDAVRS
ncbi:CDGSH iron-sulfur domain-containing protein 3, mitochondrial [Diprion similis]|uniref:CDGSH iron-sulfur domain-containing protein 3, mitochondrial n=1 Tax=Diprion similis TaxID=362088 RepID=UPI001EF8EFBC|nr:CDGSH iron-sulfur domain-containing protein 3, mitochondrial [Diprion similis]